MKLDALTLAFMEDYKVRTKSGNGRRDGDMKVEAITLAFMEDYAASIEAAKTNIGLAIRSTNTKYAKMHFGAAKRDVMKAARAINMMIECMGEDA